MFKLRREDVYDKAFELAWSFMNSSINDNHEIENSIRSLINSIINNDNMSIYQSIRRNNIEIFEFAEGIVDAIICSYPYSIVDAIYIEHRNRTLKDSSVWFTSGGILSTFGFADNNLAVDCRRVGLASTYSLLNEWISIDVYDEIDKFILKVVPFNNIVTAVYKSINEYIESHLPLCFKSVSSAVLSEFNVENGDRKAFDNLCDMVQMSGGYDNLIIAGTEEALNRLYAHSTESELFYYDGRVEWWNDKKIMPINQNKEILDDNQLFVIGRNYGCLNLEFFGNTRSFMEEPPDECEYLYIKYLIETSIGIGLLVPEDFGCFTFKS